MMRLLATILLGLWLALPARAQDNASPETLASARELASIVTGDTLKQITGAMTAQVWPTVERAVGSKVDAATLKEMRAEFERTVAVFTAEVMKNAPAVYARHFSAQELRDMIAFYKSPTGVKALHEMPKVMADVGADMAPRIQSFQGDLNGRMRTILERHGYKE